MLRVVHSVRALRQTRALMRGFSEVDSGDWSMPDVIISDLPLF
jgi:hypothetical protein